MQKKSSFLVSAPISPTDEYWMHQALEQAKSAMMCGEVPVGAVITQADQKIAVGYNQPIHACDPTAHAEINVLRFAAKQLGNYRLVGTTLYVTLEPCLMCFTAMIHARIKRLVIGAADPKKQLQRLCQNGLLNYNHQLLITTGVCAAECSEILRVFFKEKRTKKP